MKQYSFSILRYYHDILTGEFANVGVVLFIPDSYYLEAKFLNRYGRLSKMFLNVDGEHFKKVVQSIEYKLFEFSINLKRPNFFEDDVKILKTITSRALPIDDSSLQFSDDGFGITDNPSKTLEYLFERYVNANVDKENRQSRSDIEVWKFFRKPLEEKKVIQYLRPHKIISKNYEHKFEYAWKNDIWHLHEAVSFDLVESHSILEKANTWLGRGTTLNDSNEGFKLILLLGEPNDSNNKMAFTKALNIMNKMPCKKEFVQEREAKEFAEELENELKKYSLY